MASILKPRILTCVLAILVAAISGCPTSSPTGPATSAPPDAATTTPQPNLDEVVSMEPAVEETVSMEPAVEETKDPGLLGIGSAAPPLSVAKWVTGEAIDDFKPGQVYVVEFWATWCPPCRTSMPHLSKLQQEYGDEVKFVGMTREGEAIVQDFLDKEQSPGKTWAEVVQYRLALDSAGATNEAYMKAAQQPGIPTAFIVGRDAVVEWIGHPMTMDEPLAQIAAGEWDREVAIAEFKKQQKVKQLKQEVSTKARAGEWDDALAALDQLVEESGESLQLTGMRLSLLQAAGRAEEAAELQVAFVEQAWDSPQFLNQIAWGIASSEEQGDLDLALKAAQRASELGEEKDAATLDTLARVCYEMGELDKAIEWQKKAAENNQGNPSIDAALKKYEAEKAAQAEEPTVEEPAVEEPTAEESTAEESTAEEPTVEEPAAEEPAAEEPTAEEPTVEEPATPAEGDPAPADEQ